MKRADMLRTIIIISAVILSLTNVYAQFKVGDNTLVVDSASVLELESTNKGFLPSRLTTAQRDAQTKWKLGHIIYNNTDSCLQIYNGSAWDCFVQGVLVDSTIYKYDGTLNSNRILSMNGYNLTFDGSGDVIVTDDGRLGIGDLTPDAKLDVEGGTVRLSDYGSGTITGSVSRLLGVDSEGDVIEVDTSTYDNQTIDAFSFDGSNLSISLENDGQANQSVDLSSLQGTDDQVIDSFALAGNLLVISLEADGEVPKTVNLSGFLDNTDSQTLSFSSPNLTITGGNSVDLSAIDTKLTQEEVEDFAGGMVTGSTQSGIAVSYDDPSGKINFNVNDPLITLTGPVTGSNTMTDLENTTIVTSIANDSITNARLANMPANSVKLNNTASTGDPVDLTIGTNTVLGRVGGNIVAATLATNQVANDAITNTKIANMAVNTIKGRITAGTGDPEDLTATQVRTLLGISSDSSIYKFDGTLLGNRTVGLSAFDLIFDGTNDVFIQSDGDFGVGINPTRRFDVQSNLDQDAFKFLQTDVTTGERDVLTIEDQDIGSGTQDESSVLKIIKSGAIHAGDDGFSLIELANTGTEPGANKYWITGRKVDEGAVLWGVDITDNDYWSSGGIVLGVTGADGGTYSGGAFRVESGGNVGIGNTSPSTRLHVSGGTVRFQSYGAGTNTGTLTQVLGVDVNGNIIEVDPSSLGGGGSGSDSSLYKFDGTLLGNRTVSMDGNSLTFDGTTDVIIEADGDVGIGTTAPGAKLDVDNGSVRFSDYGIDTYKDTSVNNILTVQPDGDIRELNTAKNTRIFYPPGIVIDASNTVTGATVDIYQEYYDQFDSPQVVSTGAPAKIPTYNRDQLSYYVTYYDNSVLSGVSINANGVMTYNIIDVPFDNYTIINVVCVIK